MGDHRILQLTVTFFMLFCISECNELPSPQFDGGAYLWRNAESKAKSRLDSFDKKKEILEDALNEPINGGRSEMDILRELTGDARSKFISDLEDEQVSDHCILDTVRYLSDLVSFENYAWQMRSSNAKLARPAHALYELRREYLGDYELCARAENTYGAPFETQYCQMYFPFGFNYGTCQPATCSAEEVLIITNIIRSRLQLRPADYFRCIPKSIPWKLDEILVTLMVSFFAALVLVGTVYEVTTRKIYLQLLAAKKEVHQECENIGNGKIPSKDEKNTNIDLTASKTEESALDNLKLASKESKGDGHEYSNQIYTITKKREEITKTEENETKSKTQPRRRTGGEMLDSFLMSCSAINNLNKILRAKKTPDTLAALNGMRVISMCWIIYGHSNQFILVARIDNLGYLLNVSGKFWYNMVLFATYSVDTFFVLSGFLLTYLTLKTLQKTKGKMNWFLFYFHRYWRLTPALGFCIGVWTSLLARIGSGVNKKEFFDENREACREYWWTNILYFNNLYPYPGFVSSCFGWSWYLANDMQFFIITPFILVLLFNPRWRKYGLFVMGFLAVVSFSSLIGLNTYYGLPAGKTAELYNNNSDKFEPNSDITYAKPWCRINAYLVGMMYGYMLYRLKGRKLYIPWYVNLTCWFFALGLMFALIFGLHGTNDGAPPQWFSVAWLTLDRTVWSLCVGWVGFACVTGYGGPVDSFLGWQFWIPLGRLTYGCYLIHPMVIFWFLYTKKTSFHWTFQEITYFSIGNTVISYILALVLSLLVEGPTIGMEKVLLGKPTKS